MDKRSILGLVLIAVVMIVFSFLNKDNEDDKKKSSKDKKKNKAKSAEVTEELESDTLKVEEHKPELAVEVEGIDSASYKNAYKAVTADSTFMADNDSLAIDSAIQVKYEEYVAIVKESNAKLEEEAALKEKRADYGDFYVAVEGEEKEYILENDYMRITFSSQGAQVKKVELKEYRSYHSYMNDEKEPLILMDSTNRFAFNVIDDVSEDGFDFWTDELYFESEGAKDNSIKFTAKAENGKEISFSYEITNDYEVKQSISSDGMPSTAEFDRLKWEMKALHNEKSKSQENQVAGVFYKYTEDSRDMLSEMSDDDEEIEADLDWIAYKQAFFSVILISEGDIEKGGKMKHTLIENEDNPYIKKYATTFKNPGVNVNSTQTYTWYMGPNDYDNLAAYDLGMHKVVNHGWKIFGWINRNFFLPLYQWLDGMGMNQGLIILFMTIIVRLITTPLVFRNYRSSAKMRLLKPEIEEIGKKFPNPEDAMKKQQATMALYRSTGVNPIAGCLPMLIQMPILFAMFRLVPTLTELRQESFLWAEDMSSYDQIISWSAHIPLLSDFYGNHVSLFTLLMAGATLVYTLMNMNQTPTQPGMPNMKVIMYLFPVMMIFFFNKYAAGLSYYYFLSSLLSMGVMLVIKNYFIDEEKLMAQIQENKKKPKKKSRFQQRMEEMQRQQAKKTGKKR